LLDMPADRVNLFGGIINDREGNGIAGIRH
jgi:hypothetical protein